MVRGGSSVTVGSRRAVTDSYHGRQRWGRGAAGLARRVGWVKRDPTHVRWSAVGAADLSWAEWKNYDALVARFDRKPKRNK